MYSYNRRAMHNKFSLSFFLLPYYFQFLRLLDIRRVDLVVVVCIPKFLIHNGSRIVGKHRVCMFMVGDEKFDGGIEKSEVGGGGVGVSYEGSGWSGSMSFCQSWSVRKAPAGQWGSPNTANCLQKVPPAVPL